MVWWLFKGAKSRQLSAIESLLKTAIRHQEGMMGILDELKVVVDEIAADAVAMEDEVRIALDHIVKHMDLDSHPDLIAAVDSLKDSHTKLAATFTVLKDKVDEVMASGGSAS